MNYLKKILKSLLYVFLSLIIGLFFITLLSFFNIINIKVINILKIIVTLLSLFIGSFILGKKSSKKGYLEGIKFGSIIIIIFLILNLSIYKNLKLSLIILYTIYLFTCTLGSMIGITKNKRLN